MIHNGDLCLPFATSGMIARFAIVSVESPLNRLMERFRIDRTDVPRHAFLQKDIVRSAGRVPLEALRHRRT